MHMETQIKSRETIENNDASFFRSIQAYGIDYCYSQMVDNQSNLLVIPDGCIELLFACKQEKPEITYYGPMSKPQVQDLRPGYYFGVHFLPGEVPQILNKDAISIQKLLNHRLIIYGKEQKRDINAMEESILSSTDFDLQVQLFLTYYQAIYTQTHVENKKSDCVQSIFEKIDNSQGQIRTNELSDELAYSEQYINRLFKEQTGLSTKAYSNLVRFKKAWQLLMSQGKKTDLSELCQKCGYYDQSHMIKAFKKYTNQTPQALLKLLENA